MAPSPRAALLSLKRRLDDNPALFETISAFAIKMIGAALSFSFNILLARLYGASGVGQFGLAITTLTITTAVGLFGLDYVLIRTVAGDIKMGRKDLARGTINAITRIILINAVVLAILLSLGFVPLLDSKFGMAGETQVLRAITFGLLPFLAMRIVSSALRSTGRVLLAQALDGPIPMGISAALLLGAVWAGKSGSIVGAATLYTVSLSAAVLVGMVLYAQRVRTWPPAAHANAAPLLAQGWPIVTVAVTGFIVDWFVLLVLAAHQSAVEVGQFRMAWQITSLLNLVVVSFDAVAGPRIAAAYRLGDTPAISKMWRQAVAVIMMMTFPAIVLLMIFPRPLLGIFGAEFQVADNALRILLIGQLVNTVTGPVGSILIMTGRERWSLAYSLIATAVAAILSLILIPMFGIIGAALTVSATICLRNVCAYLIASKAIGLSLLRR